MAFAEASNPSSSVSKLESRLDLDHHIAAADNIINKLRNPNLNDDDDFGFDIDDLPTNNSNLSNEIMNSIPDEVMEAVNNGELDIDDIYMPDLALVSNAVNLDQASYAGNLDQASNAGNLDQASNAGPSGYLARSQTSQWRDRKRHLVEHDHDKLVDCCGDVLGRFGKKVVKKMRADPELAKKILEKLDESSDDNEVVTPARLVAHTHANEFR